MLDLKKLIALGGATIALVALPVSAALAAGGGTTVTVRVEGLKKTLLLPARVQTHSGWITRFGAPKGDCPANSAQGALDVATHHGWRGIWTTKFGPEYEITSILGETHSFTSSKDFWEIFADNASASAGGCELKLHKGEQLLFAAVPQTGVEYPLGLSAAHTVVGGKAFTVKVVWWNAAGKPRPLAGALVTASGVKARTNKHGVATIVAHHRGTLVLGATHKGYIRAAPLAVVVS
jgi:hypothetical protein